MARGWKGQRRSLIQLAIGLGAAWVVGSVAACSKPLLSPTDVRSPFDRYDAVRNQFAAQYVEDEFGKERPNIRARLTPKQ